MRLGVKHFNQFNVQLSEEANKRCGRDQVKAEQMKLHTQALAKWMLLPESEASELPKPHQIDPYAMVTISHGGTPLQAPLFDMVLEHGQRGEPAFEVLLKQVSDPNAPIKNPKSRLVESGKTPLWVAYNNRKTDYISYMVADRRVNVEAIDGRATSLLNYCCSLMEESAKVVSAVAGSKASEITDRIASRQEQLIEQLLKRDALLDPIYVEHVLQDGDSGNLPTHLLRPAIAQWQQEWQHFLDGAITADTITPSQFRHFFSLGKICHMIQSGVWDGRYRDLRGLLSDLPDWVSHHHPMELEQIMLTSKEIPEHSVHAGAKWDHRVMPLPQKEKST